MKTILNFENEETKKLLAKLDFEFFLKQNISAEKYNQVDIDTIYQHYNLGIKNLKIKSKQNKKQFNYYVEGLIRKGFTGGLLPALFHLDESNQFVITDFAAIGESWAYFEHWQKYQKLKITQERIWDIVLKTGSILAIVLSVIKVLELTH